ncbi:hypothetical protein R69746_05644 [Paraburkholderia aspalathi]|uniref:hypothetical protein n=1 Tax=Paraburkholderia aspalathi TaxID=1324617 RepID=UPI00190D13D6|nr:hypothetical protein [Paraburkholderia aspalathi]MBK3841733.1 hypothetical protein [Paraburkholderia aspalathi]CAE6811557.1 hypothetical protein R69746_05644 [Paraburkholderia aspalathi]
MRDDIPYQVTFDRRDLFDFVRGAIKGVLEDYAEKQGNVECWVHQEAHERTVELFAKIKLPGPDESLTQQHTPEEIRARCKAMGIPPQVAEALIEANCR